MISSKGKIYAVYETNPKSTQTSVQIEAHGLLYEAEKRLGQKVHAIGKFHSHPPHENASSSSTTRQYPHEVSDVPSGIDLQSDKISIGMRPKDQLLVTFDVIVTKQSLWFIRPILREENKETRHALRFFYKEGHTHMEVQEWILQKFNRSSGRSRVLQRPSFFEIRDVMMIRGFKTGSFSGQRTALDFLFQFMKNPKTKWEVPGRSTLQLPFPARNILEHPFPVRPPQKSQDTPQDKPSQPQEPTKDAPKKPSSSAWMPDVTEPFSKEARAFEGSDWSGFIDFPKGGDAESYRRSASDDLPDEGSSSHGKASLPEITELEMGELEKGGSPSSPPKAEERETSEERGDEGGGSGVGSITGGILGATPSSSGEPDSSFSPTSPAPRSEEEPSAPVNPGEGGSDSPLSSVPSERPPDGSAEVGPASAHRSESPNPRESANSSVNRMTQKIASSSLFSPSFATRDFVSLTEKDSSHGQGDWLPDRSKRWGERLHPRIRPIGPEDLNSSEEGDPTRATSIVEKKREPLADPSAFSKQSLSKEQREEFFRQFRQNPKASPNRSARPSGTRNHSFLPDD